MKNRSGEKKRIWSEQDTYDCGHCIGPTIIYILLRSDPFLLSTAPKSIVHPINILAWLELCSKRSCYAASKYIWPFPLHSVSLSMQPSINHSEPSWHCLHPFLYLLHCSIINPAALQGSHRHLPPKPSYLCLDLVLTAPVLNVFHRSPHTLLTLPRCPSYSAKNRCQRSSRGPGQTVSIAYYLCCGQGIMLAIPQTLSITPTYIGSSLISIGSGLIPIKYRLFPWEHALDLCGPPRLWQHGGTLSWAVIIEHMRTMEHESHHQWISISAVLCVWIVFAYCLVCVSVIYILIASQSPSAVSITLMPVHTCQSHLQTT